MRENAEEEEDEKRRSKRGGGESDPVAVGGRPLKLDCHAGPLSQEGLIGRTGLKGEHALPARVGEAASREGHLLAEANEGVGLRDGKRQVPGHYHRELAARTHLFEEGDKGGCVFKSCFHFF